MKRKIGYQGEARCFFALFMREKVLLLLHTNHLALWLLIGCNGCALKEQNKPNFTARL